MYTIEFRVNGQTLSTGRMGASDTLIALENLESLGKVLVLAIRTERGIQVSYQHVLAEIL